MALRALQGPAGGSAPVGGTGTTNTIPRWTGPSTLGDSGLIDDGTQIYTTARSRFGIGIATPDQGLHVLSPNNATTSGGQVTQQNFNGVSNQKWMTAVGGGDNAWVSGRGWFLRDMTAGATRLVCDTSGNVGIGTASPLSLLHVRGSSASAVQTFIHNANGGTNSAAELVFGTYSGAIPTGSGNPGPQAKISAINTNVATAQTDLAFYTYPSTGAGIVERMRINSAGTQAQSQVAIGTSSFTTGRALTTVADLDVFGVRVGRGGDGSGAANTALGKSALVVGTSGDFNTAIGEQALANLTTGASNTAIGRGSLTSVVSTDSNIAIGRDAGYNSTGASNVFIGRLSAAAAAADNNKLVIGSASYWVATNGAAATYYTTATAVSTGTLPLTCGFMRVLLNGTWVKIPVYAD